MAEAPAGATADSNFQIGSVGNWCVEDFGGEWAVINTGQEAAARTAGDSRQALLGVGGLWGDEEGLRISVVHMLPSKGICFEKN